MLFPLSDFIGAFPPEGPPDYYYEGQCPYSGEQRRLPRTPLAKAAAKGLMRQLHGDVRFLREGKMYGVLIGETLEGDRVVLKAYSGELPAPGAGWAPSIPGRERVAWAEARTLTQLADFKRQLQHLAAIPERQQLAALTQQFHQQLETLKAQHRERKADRAHRRQQLQGELTGPALIQALTALDDESRQDGFERKHLKASSDRALAPLQQIVAQADADIRCIKQQRKELSRQLQAEMHQAYYLTNFGGDKAAIAQLGRLPTGTGDCAAPKLLQSAAHHRLKPLAMAEFWYGPPLGDKLPGQFYTACPERCQPILGFLLSHPTPITPSPPPAPLLPRLLASPLPILHTDPWLIAINKPAGLLSVPGKGLEHQDSVLLRLQAQYNQPLYTIHRLDQDTSGVLLLARDVTTQGCLQRLFQERQVNKTYEAIVASLQLPESGEIALPLWGNPAERPRQCVDWQRGKPSCTHFQVVESSHNHTRVQFHPVTGRTHQLRVPSAHSEGLTASIVGDRLYGGPAAARLHLHACSLTLTHPIQQTPIALSAPTPF